MRLTVIHNPTSGDASLSAADLRSMLDDAGYQVHYASSKGEWEKSLQLPTDLVVAAGGDGTVRKVALELAATGVPFAILPVGTANNIAKSLGIIGPAQRIIRGWRRQRAQPFDVGLASAAADDHRFVESFGGGLFADLIARGEKEAEGWQAFVGRETDRALFLFRQILEGAETHRWELTLDGKDLSGSYLAVEALNTRFGGPNIPLAPDADVGDGMLEVVLVRGRDRRRLLDYVDRRLRLGAGPLEPLRVHKGHYLRLVLPTGARLHLDDEVWPRERSRDRIGGGDRSRRRGRDGRAARVVDVLVRPGAARVVTGL